jgi:hypothetical protein
MKRLVKQETQQILVSIHFLDMTDQEQHSLEQEASIVEEFVESMETSTNPRYVPDSVEVEGGVYLSRESHEALKDRFKNEFKRFYALARIQIRTEERAKLRDAVKALRRATDELEMQRALWIRTLVRGEQVNVLAHRRKPKPFK